jgi:hypothetical protein
MLEIPAAQKYDLFKGIPKKNRNFAPQVSIQEALAANLK